MYGAIDMWLLKKCYTGNVININCDSKLVGSFVYEGWFFESPVTIHAALAKNLDSDSHYDDLKIVDFKRVR
jgi:hypothetical protein